MTFNYFFSCATKSLAVATLMFFILQVNAQVAVNTDGSNPDASATLDVKSVDKGFLIPRMAHRDFISSTEVPGR